MIELKCISREVFERFPHYMVFRDGKKVATIYLLHEADGTRDEVWALTGIGRFLANCDDFDSAQSALDFVMSESAFDDPEP